MQMMKHKQTICIQQSSIIKLLVNCFSYGYFIP